MLDFLRKRKRSWTIFLIVGVISFVFILYFGSSSLVEDPTLGPVAKVNGETITATELNTLVARALRSNRSSDGFPSPKRPRTPKPQAKVMAVQCRPKTSLPPKVGLTLIGLLDIVCYGWSFKYMPICIDHSFFHIVRES